ncbi:MAG: hypothetical protein ACOCZE_03700 [Planctomycetota bacterium]
MTLAWTILLIAAAVAGAHLAINILPHLIPSAGPGGHSRDGLVIFVEPTRWLGVRWGYQPLRRALAGCGFGGKITYWPWQRWWQGTLVLPAMRSDRLHHVAAVRLARRLTMLKRACPDRPIWLVGFSAGARVAVEALSLLDPACRIEAAALVGAAISPRADLSGARASCSQLRVACSWGDWLLLGLGTTLVGTADGRRGPAMGLIGACDLPLGNVPSRFRDQWFCWGHFGSCHAATVRNIWPRFVRDGRNRKRPRSSSSFC